MRTDLAAIAIIMGLATVVNARERKSLNNLIKEAQASGEAGIAHGDDVAIGRVPAGTPSKTLEVDSADAADGASHDFIVFEKDGVPLSVNFAVIREGARSDEFINLICDTSGEMRRCFRQTGQKDQAGKPIPGSGRATEFRGTDKKMSALLRHELDFWLKGKYRKIAAKP